MAIEFLIEYTLDESALEDADAVRRKFLDDVRAWGDPGFRYRVFAKGDEGVSFAHHAWIEDEAAQQRLNAQQFFADFQAGMGRVTGGNITATNLTELGSA